MKTKVIAVVSILFVFTAAAVLYAHFSGTDVPKVEVEARFADADTNKDGNLSKEEFAKYLASQNRVKTVSKSKEAGVRICPTTGAPCTGEGMCSSGNGEACGGGGCGSGGEGGCCSSKGMGAKTVQVKSSNVTEVAEKKEGGCCGGKSKADGAAGGCCGGKNKAADATAGEKKEGGCCGAKAGAEKKEGGCCKMKAERETKEVVATETETAEKE